MVFTGEDVEGDSGDNSSEDSDEGEEQEDVDEDALSTFLKEAKATSYNVGENAADSTPLAKKQKLEDKKEENKEMPAFADSEDELEWSDGEGEAGRAGDSGHCSDEDEADSDGEEEEDDDDDEEEDGTPVKKESASEEEEDEQGK